jgi:aminoglycoside 3-N-acetyltransferase
MATDTTDDNREESNGEPTDDEGDGDRLEGVGNAIERVDEPVTVDRLVSDLRELGVDAGDTLIVHASMSSIGYVAGAAQAVVEALMAAVTDEGTLVMPTHSYHLMDPATFTAQPVPDDWEASIRESSTPYRPDVTPTTAMGAVAETFRDYPDTRRSRHPTASFAAWGAAADRVVADHPWDPPMGEGSPLAAVYDLDGRVLRIGTEANTSLHLAEHRAPGETPTQENGGPILTDEGDREWVTFEEVDGPEDFRDAEAAFEEAGGEVLGGTVGAAETTLVSQPELIDFATEWFGEHR